MNNSGKTTRSAPCAAAAARALFTFSTLPARSPTVELSCATAMASFSAGRTLIGKLYRLDVPSGNGVLASLICTKKRSKRAEMVAAPQDFTYRYGLEIQWIGGHWSDPAPAGKPVSLLHRRPQSSATAAERHRARWLQTAAVKVKSLQVFFDHALDHHGLIVSAEGCALTPMTNFGLRDFCEIGSLDRIDLQQAVVVESRVIFRSV